VSDHSEAPRRTFVIVTGLAGAGKTTVGEPLAAALGVPYISKDRIKEALFDAVGYGGWALSKTLSHASDLAMVRIARDLDGAVLDNFWHPDIAADLLAPLSGRMIELYCRCRPAVAFERWSSRRRHPGHADDENRDDANTFAAYAERLPLATFGPVIEVDAEAPTDIAQLVSIVRDAQS
jgi:hypothetical protein